jgi:hypothetical protein
MQSAKVFVNDKESLIRTIETGDLDENPPISEIYIDIP